MNQCNQCKRDCTERIPERRLATIPLVEHELKLYKLYKERKKMKRWKTACFALIGAVLILALLLVLT